MEQVKPSKKIIQYLDHLTQLSDVEQIFSFINQELKRFKKVRDTFLCFSPGVKNRCILFTENKKISMKPLSESWPQGQTIRIDSSDDSHYIANHIKRPVGQLLAFPILMSQGSPLYKLDVPATIYVEHIAGQSGVADLIQDLLPYIQPLQYALERSFLQSFLRGASIEWQNTFDGLKDPICIIDIEFNALRSNLGFSDGRSHEKCYELFSGDQQKCKGCPVPKVIETNSYQTAVVKNRGKNYEVHSYPIKRSKDESVTTIVSHYVDVSKKQELLSKMLQSEKLAVIGHLAGNIAHELNNPLTGIRSLADILTAEVNEDLQLKSDLKEVSAAAERCQKIIKSLMLFSSDHRKTNKQVVSMKEQVEVSLTLLKSSFRSLNVSINLENGDDKIFIIPELFIQVIYNLVQNACQASKEGGALYISTVLQPGVVLFKVKDEGGGIPKEIISEIFTPFFTTKDKGQGTGLGLSMSQSVVESFGGKIIVSSEEGEGSEFIVRLPRASGATL